MIMMGSFVGIVGWTVVVIICSLVEGYIVDGGLFEGGLTLASRIIGSIIIDIGTITVEIRLASLKLTVRFVVTVLPLSGGNATRLEIRFLHGVNITRGTSTILRWSSNCKGFAPATVRPIPVGMVLPATILASVISVSIISIGCVTSSVLIISWLSSCLWARATIVSVPVSSVSGFCFFDQCGRVRRSDIFRESSNSCFARAYDCGTNKSSKHSIYRRFETCRTLVEKDWGASLVPIVIGVQLVILVELNCEQGRGMREHASCVAKGRGCIAKSEAANGSPTSEPA